MKALPLPGPFRGISNTEELAYQLQIPHKDLMKWAYRKGNDERYTEFEIPKKRGGTRTIHAPKEPLKAILQTLLELHRGLDSFPNSVHGFRQGRSIVTNAEKHVRKRCLRQYDIADFFPSINFRRVKGLLLRRPFSYPPAVAVCIAKLCTYNGKLPQGSPMSPFISNMIMRGIDSKFTSYAKENYLSYTRYADDLSFSTMRQAFPDAKEKMLNVFTSHAPLDVFVQKTVESAGFHLNPNKTRTSTQKDRMIVTGIVVNKKLNISRDYIRRIRTLLHLAEKMGLEKANQYFLERIDEKASARIDQQNALLNTLRGRISYVTRVRGKDDLLVQRFKDRLAEILEPGSSSPLVPLRALWLETVNEMDGAVRGYRFENFWNSLLAFENFEMTTGFRAVGEQIDGAFKFENQMYLVECKASKSRIETKDIDVLYGKLGRRPQNTRGLMVALNGFTNNAFSLVTEYRDKNIQLLTGIDIERVLSGQTTLIETISKLSWGQSAFRSISINDKYDVHGYM